MVILKGRELGKWGEEVGRNSLFTMLIDKHVCFFFVCPNERLLEI